jgi:hypothetical protein
MVSSTSHSAAPGARRGRRRGPLAAVVASVVIIVVFVGGGLYAWRSLFPPAQRSDSCQVVGESTGNVYTMSPEQLYNASIITGVAMRRALPERADVIALATAQQESKLRNLAGGDADSVGLFQQRPSQGWGTVAELTNPPVSAGKFFDALVKVKDWQSLPLADAAQAVQHSAYPDAYRDWEPRATALAGALTGETAGQLSCRLVHPGVTAATTRVMAPGASTAFTGAPTVAGATALVTAQLAADLGVTAPSPVSSQQVATLVVAGLDGTDPKRRPDTVAAWALAHAAFDGITSVTVSDQDWQAGRGTWKATDHPADPGTVTITIRR